MSSTDSSIDVEFVLKANGDVHVRRIRLRDSWVSVQQGRQWRSNHGRFVLVMLPDNTVLQLCLSPEALVWQIVPRAGGRAIT